MLCISHLDKMLLFEQNDKPQFNITEVLFISLVCWYMYVQMCVSYKHKSPSAHESLFMT